MARYWIADLHLGHAKVAELRGFETIEAHDEAVLKSLYRLAPTDEVWMLGDLSSGRAEGEANALARLSEVSATLHLIAGNHDSVSSIHRHGYRQQRRFLDVFESVQQFGRIRLHGRDVLMSHYPYASLGDGEGRGPARYAEYRLPEQGLPLVHGHTHQDQPHEMGWLPTYRHPDGTVEVELVPRDRRQFCVSWDAHRQLVTENILTEWIKELP